MKANPITGATYLFRGASLLNKPSIRPFVLIPLLINIILFTGFIWYSALQIEKLQLWFEGWLWSWLSWLSWILWPLFLLLALFIMAYTFTLVANFISAPFNGLLADKVETYLANQARAESGLAGSAQNAGNEVIEETPMTSIMIASIKRELSKLFYVIPMGLLMLILSFIPVLNILSYVIGAWMLSIEYGDYPMDNNEITFKEARRKLKARRLSSLGFGGVTMAITLVPVINFFVMPAAVCGGVLFWKEELENA